MITAYMSIAVGGALGALSRSLMSQILPTSIFTYIPFPILSINVLGCLIMGALTEIMALYWSPSPEIRAFLIPGFLGGFTTFSTFALEFALLSERGLHWYAIFYVFLSVTVSLFSFFSGLWSIRWLLT